MNTAFIDKQEQVMPSLAFVFVLKLNLLMLCVNINLV